MWRALGRAGAPAQAPIEPQSAAARTRRLPPELDRPMQLGRPVGAALRAARQAEGLALAELARCVQTSPGHLGNLERGASAPSLALSRRIVDWLPMPDDVKAGLMEVAEEVERRRLAREQYRLAAGTSTPGFEGAGASE
jgi:transcriptional regulator with XRE-family HTH domain